MTELDTMYRVMILYMLNLVEYPLTNTQITNFVLEKEYTNYFTVQEAITSLLQTDLITAESTHNNTRYHLTDYAPYIKIPVLEKDFHFSGSDWNGLITMVRADVNVPEREDVLRLLEKIVRLENQDSPYLGGELKRLKGGRPYSYLYKFHFPKLRSSMVKICYDSDPINPVRDTVYIHTRDTLCIRDTVTVIAPVKKRPFCMAVKTNLLYDAVLIPDIGVEFCLGKNWSVAGNWMYAWWKSDRKHNYWRIYGGDVELRRWFGRRAVEKPFSGHHVGLYGQIVTYDFELGGKGYLGDKWSYGGGVAYGYSLPVGHRFNVDFTLGIGYLGGFAISCRLVDPCIKQTCREAIRKSIIFICKRNVSEVIRNDTFVNRQICQRHTADKGSDNSAKRDPAVHLSCVLSAPFPHRNDPYDQSGHTDNDHNKLKRVKIISRQLQCV